MFLLRLQPQNCEVFELLQSRFCVALPQFLRAFHQPSIVSSLLLLAAFLPLHTAPMLRYEFLLLEFYLPVNENKLIDLHNSENAKQKCQKAQQSFTSLIP